MSWDLFDDLMGQLTRGLGAALIPSTLVCFALGRRLWLSILLGAIAGMTIPVLAFTTGRVAGPLPDQLITLLFAAIGGGLIGLMLYPLKRRWFESA